MLISLNLQGNIRGRLSEEKNRMKHKCNREHMGKKGKKYPANQIARKKNSWWPEITHPHPQELNGRPLNTSLYKVKSQMLNTLIKFTTLGPVTYGRHNVEEAAAWS